MNIKFGVVCLSLTACLLLLHLNINELHASIAQEDNISVFTNKIFNDHIKTVQLYRKGWNMSYPVINISDDDVIELNFDLVESPLESYYYTFIHCNKDWQKSDIITNEYMEGFPENEIEDVSASFNTTVSYYHYRISFPNENVKFNISGNYIIFIYPFGDEEHPVLTQRFIISEDAVPVTVDLHRPLLHDDRDSGHQVDFTVDIAKANIIDSYRNIYSSILQNGRWDNAKTNLKPNIYGTTELKYNSLSDANIFMAGNEYRSFDSRDIRYKSENIADIIYSAPCYNIMLKKSESRENKPYFYVQDFNGKYYIAVDDRKNYDTEADYIFIFFTFPVRYPIADGDMYLSGNLTNWAIDDKSKMHYNADRSCYETSIQLKQGWYNFKYLFVGSDNKVDETRFEGSHYETENDYTVIIYYRDPKKRYDRVIAAVTANTKNNISR